MGQQLLGILLHLPSSRQHLSKDDCLEDKKEDYQNCCVLYCVQQLCTVSFFVTVRVGDPVLCTGAFFTPLNHQLNAHSLNVSAGHLFVSKKEPCSTMICTLI